MSLNYNWRIILSENTIRLKGRYYKIVIDEPLKKKASIIFGILKDVDHKKRFWYNRIL